MEVRQLIGPYAGRLLEMPFDVAMNCISAGTACKPGDESLHKVRGLKMVEEPTEVVEEQAPDEFVPDPTEEPKGAYPAARKGRRASKK